MSPELREDPTVDAVLRSEGNEDAGEKSLTDAERRDQGLRQAHAVIRQADQSIMMLVHPEMTLGQAANVMKHLKLVLGFLPAVLETLGRLEKRIQLEEEIERLLGLFAKLTGDNECDLRLPCFVPSSSAEEPLLLVRAVNKRLTALRSEIHDVLEPGRPKPPRRQSVWAFANLGLREPSASSEPAEPSATFEQDAALARRRTERKRLKAEKRAQVKVDKAEAAALLDLQQEFDRLLLWIRQLQKVGPNGPNLDAELADILRQNAALLERARNHSERNDYGMVLSEVIKLYATAGRWQHALPLVIEARQVFLDLRAERDPGDRHLRDALFFTALRALDAAYGLGRLADYSALAQEWAAVGRAMVEEEDDEPDEPEPRWRNEFLAPSPEGRQMLFRRLLYYLGLSLQKSDDDAAAGAWEEGLALPGEISGHCNESLASNRYLIARDLCILHAEQKRWTDMRRCATLAKEAFTALAACQSALATPERAKLVNDLVANADRMMLAAQKGS